MSVNLEKLIDLSLLTYYDSKIKEYINGNVIVGNDALQFTDNLPLIGTTGIIYIYDYNLYMWNPDSQKYVKLSDNDGGSESSIPDTWTNF